MKNAMYILKTLSLLLVLGFAIVSTGCSKNNIETIEIAEETTEETETTSTPPTLTAFTASIAENAVAGASVGKITVNTGDSAITTINLSGTGSENFAVDTSGNITLSSSVALDYETTVSYTLSAIAASDAGNSASVVVTVNITNVADVVSALTAFTGSIAENAVAGASVGTMTTNAGDSAITAITLSGTGNESFAVDTTGNITLSSSAALDFETTTSYDLSAIATNSAGDSESVDVTISITNIVDAPTLIAFTGSIAENEAAGASVGKITVNTGDSEITAITLSGTGNENFAVDTAGNITLSSSAALDYETTMSYTLSAIATTSVGDSNSADVTISITDYFSPLEIAKMTASSDQTESNFGTSVAISGNYIVVGAPVDDGNAAYLFKKDAGGVVSQIIKFTADDGAGGDHFGRSVAILGDYIVIGAPYDDDNASNSGSAYLFKINTDDDTVSEVAKLTATDGAAGGFFGYSVAISGDYIVVGAYGDGGNSGSAYLFKINTDDDTVSETTKLTASDGSASDYFGGAVAISGDYIVVGASEDDGIGFNSGSAYIFKIDSDESVPQIEKLTADDGAAADRFGWSVAILGDYIAVGADFDDDKGSNSGSVYVFKIDSDNAVSQIAKLTASDGAAFDYFGQAVAISGDYLVIGAEYDGNATNSGSIYVYKINPDDTIIEKVKLAANDGVGLEFGHSVAIDEGYIIVGSELKTRETQYASGSAYTIALEAQNRPYWENYVAEIEVVEGTTDIYTVLTNSINTGDIIVSLSGVDADNFVIINDVITSDGTLTYANPLDSDTDSFYEITVILEDAEGKTYSYDISIEIGNSIT